MMENIYVHPKASE